MALEQAQYSRYQWASTEAVLKHYKISVPSKVTASKTRAARAVRRIQQLRRYHVISRMSRCSKKLTANARSSSLSLDGRLRLEQGFADAAHRCYSVVIRRENPC